MSESAGFVFFLDDLLLTVTMNTFDSNRFLLLSNGCSIGIFVHSLSHVYLVMSEDGSFVHLTDTNVNKDTRSSIHLTRFAPSEYKAFVTMLLTFRNRHSCVPYCVEEYHGSASEVHCGDHTVRWRADPAAAAPAKSTSGGGGVASWRTVYGERDHFVSLVSKVALCPLQKRISFEYLATYYTESVLGTDNLKEEKCALVRSQFAIATCPVDLKSLALALLPALEAQPLPPRSLDKSLSSHERREAAVNQVTPEQAQVYGGQLGWSPLTHTVIVTNTVSATPLGASHSSSALRLFASLSPELSLLRDLAEYPCCDGTACTVVEQLDVEGHREATAEQPFRRCGGRQWRGCTFVYSSGADSGSAGACGADERSAAWRLQLQQSVEVEAWLGEGQSGREGSGHQRGGLGGVISVRGDMVRLQLYAQGGHGKEVDKTRHQGCAAADKMGIAVDGGAGSSGAATTVDHSALRPRQLDFTVHLCVFESYMNGDFDDNDDDDVDADEECSGGGGGGVMSWSRLTEESLGLLSRVELALHFKQVVLHLLSMRQQLLAHALSHSLEHMSSKNMGLVYLQHQHQHQRESAAAGVLHRSFADRRCGSGGRGVERYHAELPRQLQFYPERDSSSGCEEKSWGEHKEGVSWKARSRSSSDGGSGGGTCCGDVVASSRDGAGGCFTLMGDGTTRAVFRGGSASTSRGRDRCAAMIMEYLPHMQAVRTILGDGSERVLSVPMLLQLATTSSTSGSRSNTGTSLNVAHGRGVNGVGGVPELEEVARNLLRLLAFRRFAILPEEGGGRSQLFLKDKAVAVSVVIAQMRNTNYLKRNSALSSR